MRKGKLSLGIQILLNIFSQKKYNLFYIGENADWVISRLGQYILEDLKKRDVIHAKLALSHIGLRHKIIHFGSVNSFLTEEGPRPVHPSNTVILTWYHVVPDDPRIQYIPLLNQIVYRVHTSCQATKEKLISFGLEEKKIIIIPLGVELPYFFPAQNITDKKLLRKKLNLPGNKILIGSFQKDGEGWDDGFSPKLIKGPDIFCQVVENLAKRYDIHVVLTGPARGYVKKRLEKANVSYSHRYLENYLDIADYFRVLDFYLIASREEGGPIALLESLASGIPLISTPVGMVPDIIKHEKNGMLAPINDSEKLTQAIIKLIETPSLKEQIVTEGLATVRYYSLQNMASRLYQEVYLTLLSNKLYPL